MKIDMLEFATVRTDPIVNPTTLSDHIHTFYGATVARPETTYQDLRNAYGGSGDVQENQSLYWHPTIYKVQPDGTKTLVNMYIASAYYIWETGQTVAFPDGFKMIAFVPESEADGWFPAEPQDELETSIDFPSCWDGVNIDSTDHMSHVAYSSDRTARGICPPSHPIKVPHIQFFVRVYQYEGGPHIFSDGTTRMHADYFSGWKNTELQYVLDNCQNDSFDALPDQFCEDFVSFKNLPKVSSACGSLEANLAKIQSFQPSPLDTSTITDEIIDGVTVLPRGEGTGLLKPPGAVATLPPRPTLAPLPFTECDGDGGGDEGDDNEGDDGGEEDDEEEDDEEEDDEEKDDEGEDGEEGDDEGSDEDCEDSEDGIFINNRLGDKTCGWLALRPSRAARLCASREDIAEHCPDTCLECP